MENTSHPLRVVVDLESDDAPALLGTYIRTDEDTVLYVRPGEFADRRAPADCVGVIVITP
jgi:hypothetical protein